MKPTTRPSAIFAGATVTRDQDLSPRERHERHVEQRRRHHEERLGLLEEPRRSPEELRTIAEAAASYFTDADTDTLLRWVATEFGYRTAVACSMADAVLPHVVSRQLPWVDTLFLQTGYHFAETNGTRDVVESSLEVTIIDVLPRASVAEQDAEHGPRLYERDPALCCQLRKVEPLHAILADYEVWITGVRRDESPLRATTPLVTWDEKNQLVKVNPLAAWSWDELLAWSAEHSLPTNPLLNDGYPSIGCAPCTRRVEPGDDPRAGRWAGSSKTECGLHT